VTPLLPFMFSLYFVGEMLYCINGTNNRESYGPAVPYNLLICQFQFQILFLFFKLYIVHTVILSLFPIRCQPMMPKRNYTYCIILYQ
jgi:hypothetical protein